ncbi:retropepsin-like aspartic protease [uncultured Maribacter sp.]|uniref:retropepsin-like aspartic protease n=1 Tax=uncultured Maribacter sp. TaxID=431308 RepID=UPI002614214A|nr:retropepsin-like aspartic protease [uncultured Maribacter sp.]
MRIIKLLFFLILLTTVIGCAGSKAKKYLKEGKTIQSDFKTIIPFEMRNGFIILKVEIKDKPYDFLLDTGASNTISPGLAEEINIKLLGSELIYDIYNNPQDIEYGRVDNIRIGNIDFVETVSAIIDFSSVPTWASMKIDGFIGSNLMQHAIWDFDFKKKLITITDIETNLNLPEEIAENKLFIGYASIPSIATKINEKKVWNFTVDFGFNGGINIPYNEFKKQVESEKIIDYTQNKTQGVVGIYGKQNKERDSYIGTINEIEFGNYILREEKVYAEEYLGHLFGLDFFRDYRVILNWNSKKIKLIKNTDDTNSK